MNLKVSKLLSTSLFTISLLGVNHVIASGLENKVPAQDVELSRQKQLSVATAQDMGLGRQPMQATPKSHRESLPPVDVEKLVEKRILDTIMEKLLESPNITLKDVYYRAEYYEKHKTLINYIGRYALKAFIFIANGISTVVGAKEYHDESNSYNATSGIITENATIGSINVNAADAVLSGFSVLFLPADSFLQNWLDSYRQAPHLKEEFIKSQIIYILDLFNDESDKGQVLRKEALEHAIRKRLNDLYKDTKVKK